MGSEQILLGDHSSGQGHFYYVAVGRKISDISGLPLPTGAEAGFPYGSVVRHSDKQLIMGLVDVDYDSVCKYAHRLKSYLGSMGIDLEVNEQVIPVTSEEDFGFEETSWCPEYDPNTLVDVVEAVV